MQHSTKSASHGIIYVAFGYDYLVMALHSAETAKRYNADTPLTVVTNVRVGEFVSRREAPWSVVDTFVFLDDDDARNRFEKTRIDQHSPYAKTLYLDCDTEIQGDLTPLFLGLDYFDIALKVNLPVRVLQSPTKNRRKVTKTPYPTLANGLRPTELAGWNGGVIAFRTSETTSAFFELWNRLYRQQGGGLDQPSLHRALYETRGIRILSLNAGWNLFWSDRSALRCPVSAVRLGPKPARIFHYNDPGRYRRIASNLLRLHNALEATVVGKTEQTMPQQLRNYRIRYRVMAAPLLSTMNRIPPFRILFRFLAKWLYGFSSGMKRQSSRL